MIRRPRLRRLAHIAGYVGAGIVALALVIAIGAPLCFRGARFGWLVERALPETRGHINIGGGHWSWGTVFALLRGRPAALAFEDITITDPENTEVLHIGRVSARIEAHRSPTRVIVHDLVLSNGRWRWANMTGDKKKVGFLAALESAARATRRPAKKTQPASFSIAGARLEHVEVTFAASSWGLVLHDASGTGALGIKDGLFTWEVKDVDVPGGGRLRILGEKTGVVLPFERGRLDRVATTADDPDSIRLGASGVATGASRTSGGGVFTGIYGLSPASKRSGIDFQAHIENAADAANAIAAERGLAKRVHVGGAGADLRLRFQQPFDRVAIDAEARGFDVKFGDIDVRKLGVHVAAEPLAGRFRVERLSLASPQGGRLEAEATLDRLHLDASVNATRFAARALLPAPLKPFAGGTIDGMLHARADLLGGDAELVRSTLVITRAEGESGPPAIALIAGKSVKPPAGATVVRLAGARLVDGVLRIPHVALGMWGGTFAAEGRIALWDVDERHWLSPPRLDLTLQGSGIQIERLIGSGLARGAVSFRAHAQGTTDDLKLDLTFTDPRVLTVLGEKVRLPADAELRLADSSLALGNLPLGGPGDSALICSGRIGLSGRLALDVGVVRFPIARLPGLSGTSLPVGGSISGSVRITGEPRAPALSGEFTLTDVIVGKTALGGGTIAIAPERHGAVRARGHLTDAIAVDGRLAPKAAGLEGDLTLTLTRLPLEPFLPALPGGLKAAGFVSGSGVARIAPGEPATAEAKLSELTVSLSSTDRRGPPAAVEVRAENEIVVRARAGDGLSLSPARFRSGAGWIEIAGESHLDEQRATVRGQLQLAAAAPFARTWFKGMAGAVDVDLAASAGGDLKDAAVSGTVAVTSPVFVKLVAAPIEASIASGRLRITRNVVDTTALPIAVRADRFPVAAIRRLDMNARLTARFDGSNARGRFNAAIALDRLDVDVPLVGRKPIHSSGGQIDVTGEASTGKVDVTRIDLPIAAEADALTAAPGATIDRASVAVRVRGNARQLALSGDVDLGSAHVRADALKKTPGSGGGTGGGGKGPLAGHPEIEAMRLDVRVRSHGGAIHVDVNNLPDLRVDVDMHVGGTAKKPSISGSQKGANLWSSFVLALARLFS